MLRLALVPLVALVDASVLRGQSGRHLQNSDAGATPLAVTPPRSPAPSSIYGKIYVGVPPQEFLVVYDTGSGNMFLPDRACQSTSCMTKHSYDKLLSKAAEQVPNATSVPEEAGALVALATLLVSLTCSLGTLRTPQAPTFQRREEVTKSISSETVSTATGSTESPRSPRSSCSEASVSCWPFKDLFAPCMGVMGVSSVSLTVGHGSVVGHPTLDKVCLQPQKVCASTTFVAAAEMSDVPFSLYPFDGVVGLGMPGLSRNKEYNFLGNLAEAQALEKDRFSVWLSKEVDHEDSEIAFGDIPMTRVGSEIAWFPLSSTEGLWQVEMKDLTVNLVRQGLCKGFTCHVAFDTGTGVLAGPRHMVEALKQELNVASDCSNWDGLPALGVELADGVFNIEKYEYVQKSNEGCFLQMAALDTVKPVLFLGTPFLERYVTIYDRAFLRVGLAFAVHRGEATGESLEEAQERLMGREALGET